MAKTYVEVLVDGLTVGGVVRTAGDAVGVDNFSPQSKKDQVKRWGEPRYREISKAEFDELGGVEGESLGPFAEERAQVAEISNPEVDGGAGAPSGVADPAASEFADLEGSNVDDTLSAVAEFDDDRVQRFVEWEKANANRKGVLEPLGFWAE